MNNSPLSDNEKFLPLKACKRNLIITFSFSVVATMYNFLFVWHTNSNSKRNLSRTLVYEINYKVTLNCTFYSIRVWLLAFYICQIPNRKNNKMQCVLFLSKTQTHKTLLHITANNLKINVCYLSAASTAYMKHNKFPYG